MKAKKRANPRKSPKGTQKAKKSVAKKAAAKKPAANKPVAKKAVAKKASKKSVARTPARKVVTKKAATKKAATKKPAQRAAAKRPARKDAARPRVRRRDGGGHIDPTYAAELLEKTDRDADDTRAFIDAPHSDDDLAEELGDEIIQRATGEDEGSTQLDAEVEEETGGPFVVTTGSTELASGVDESNPEDAEREPFPTT